MGKDSGDAIQRASELAKELGRRGGLKGGPARAQKMTPEARSAAARKAVLARWAKSTAKDPEATKRYLQDVGKRKEAVQSLAQYCGARAKDGRFILGRGPFMVLHFDLMKISGVGKLERTDAYKGLEELVTANGGMRLSESVYLIRCYKGQTSKQSAVLFWNLLGDRLKGRLVMGDSFFIQFNSEAPDDMGVIGESVPVSRLLSKIVPGPRKPR